MRKLLARGAAAAAAAALAGCVMPGPAIYQERWPTYMVEQQQALQRQLAESGVDVVREGDSLVVRMPNDIVFEVNRAEVQARFHPVLDAMAHTVGRYPDDLVQVVGHTDATGSAAYNQALSERRATAVAAYFVAAGVPAPRLQTLGRGRDAPVAPNDTPEGRALNRRVEVVLRPGPAASTAPAAPATPTATSTPATPAAAPAG